MNIQLIARDRLMPSPTNPRKKFDPDKLAELAGTIREHGVLEPLLVRCLADGKKGGRIAEAQRYEIIAGERRWRASELAGLTELPCLVKELTDQQVLEVQYIENLQRDDLSAIEEAEGFARLIESGAYSAETLAEKLGKSRSHVFGRLKLSRLQGPAREALERGDLPGTIGMLAAQLPTEKLQKKFVGEVIEGRETWNYGKMERVPLSFRQAEELLHRDYVRALNGAFDVEAEDLVKGCGSCTACPDRSGNMRGFFGGSPNVCTNVECYDRKVKAAGELKLKEAEAKGQKVIRLKEAQAIGYRLRDQYPEIKSEAYVGDFTSKAYGKKWTALLGKDLPKVLVQTEEGVEERVDAKRAVAKLEEKGLLKRKAKGVSDAEKKEREESQVAAAVTARAMERLVDSISNPIRATRIEDEFHVLLCSAILSDEVQIYDSYERAAKRRGIEAVKKDHWKDIKTPFLAYLRTLPAAQVRGLLAELILGVRAYGDCDYGRHGQDEEEDEVNHFRQACRKWGVNLQEVEKEVRAEFAAAKAGKGKKGVRSDRAEQNAKAKQFREAAGIPLANAAEEKEFPGIQGNFVAAPARTTARRAA